MAAASLSRGVRAALFAAVCVVLSAAGHVMMSGSDVAWWALAAAFLVTGAGAWGAAGRQRGPVAIVGGLLGAQVLLHHLFAWAQGGAHGAMPMPMPVPLPIPMPVPVPMRANMAMSADMDMGMGMGAGMDVGDAAHCVHGSLGMVVVHGLAAVVCGLWLWWGESAFFRLLRCLGMLAVRAFGSFRLLIVCFVRPVQRASVRALARAELPVDRLRAALLCHVVSRRGPPSGSACLACC
ncbi:MULTISPECIES: hypothetical protein [unclassified Streptomyces]|uniref:hypothetical protein n=1 Tax=unclassified Streptomyces TaxID=2593676 RepID=UPI000377C02E|nr:MULTISPECIES: hypothetical protein [unclassified Streptomyces]MYT29659.1 hypothetical protein [Streptomyces sp. SID8354]